MKKNYLLLIIFLTSFYSYATLIITTPANDKGLCVGASFTALGSNIVLTEGANNDIQNGRNYEIRVPINFEIQNGTGTATSAGGMDVNSTIALSYPDARTIRLTFSTNGGGSDGNGSDDKTDVITVTFNVRAVTSPAFGTIKCSGGSVPNSNSASHGLLASENVPVIYGVASSYCKSVTNVAITASPSNGSFTALGGLTDNSGGSATLNPSSMSNGGKTITYTTTGGICNTAVSVNTTINPLPISGVNFTFNPTASNTSFYYTNPAFDLMSLSGAELNPSTGTFSGTGVVANKFYPSVAGVGANKTVTYTYTDGNGCANSQNVDFTVISSNANINNLSSTYCANDNVNHPISVVVPSWATFTNLELYHYTHLAQEGLISTGGNNFTFNPTGHGSGGVGFTGSYKFVIHYYYTTLPIYTYTDTIPMTVDGGSYAYFTIPVNSCQAAGAIATNPFPAVSTGATGTGFSVVSSRAYPALTAISTPGGLLSGSGNSTFNPNVVSVTSIYRLRYTYINSSGCLSRYDDSIIVYMPPSAPTANTSSISFAVLNAQYCLNEYALPMVVNTLPNEFYKWYDDAARTLPLTTSSFLYPSVSTAAPLANKDYYVTANITGIASCESGNTNFKLQVFDVAKVNAGSDGSTCQQLSSTAINLNGSRSNAASSSTWTAVNGVGIINNPSNLVTSYQANTSPIAPTDLNKKLIFRLKSNDPLGPCPADSDDVEITLNPLPLPTIFNLDTTLCRNEASMDLSGNFGTDVGNNYFSGLGVVSTGIQYKFNPSIPGVGTHKIVYHAKDINGCIDSVSKFFKVYPIPNVGFTVSSNCEGDDVSLTDTSIIVAGSVISARKWKIGGLDKGTNSTLINKFIPYGDYIISLSDTSITGGDVANKCSNNQDKLVHIAPYPVANFSWLRACNGDTTFYTNLSTVASSSGPSPSYFFTNSWSMDILLGDAGVGSYKSATGPSSASPRFQYTSPGLYKARLSTITQRNIYIDADAIPDLIVPFPACLSDTVVEIYNLPTVAPTASTPYATSFALSDMNWAASGNSSSWLHTNPLNKDSMAITRPVWVTSDGKYNVGEKSSLNSPCFNFTGLNKPMVMLKLWSATTSQVSGTILQSSTDGINWSMIGTTGDGQNWYNNQGIIGQSGIAGNSLAQGWSGQYQDWQNSKVGLTSLSGNAKVRFRLFFAASTDNSGITEGIALDSVWIGNRQKVVLMEHFTNNSSSNITTAPITAGNNAMNTVRDTRKNDVASIYYHTSFPVQDPFNTAYPAGPSSRVLYYGVSSAPRTVLDGNYYNGSVYTVGTADSRVDVKDVDARSLETALFKIDMTNTFTPGVATVLTNVKYVLNDPFTNPILLHTVITEDDSTGAVKYSSIARQMLPDAAGDYISKLWGKDTSHTFSHVWNHTLPNTAKLGVVSFVQDATTKEVYQAAYLRGTGTLGAPVVLGTISETEEFKVQMFPNPATDEVFFLFGKAIREASAWEVYDNIGRRIDNGICSAGKEGFSLNTSNYTGGVYHIKLTGEKGAVDHKELIVIH